MHEARPETLKKLEPLIEEVRRRPQLEEKAPGEFYAESRLFLRFMEDGEACYADLRWPHGHEFDRFEVGSEVGARQLLSALDSRFGRH